VYLIGTLAFSQLEQVLGLFIERTWLPAGGGGDSAAEHLRRAAALTAYFLVVVGVTAAAVQGVLIGRLARLFGERRLVQVGTTIVATSMAVLPWVGALKLFPLFLALAPVIAVGTGLTNPSLPSLLSRASGAETYGGMLGLGQSLSALGRVLGPSMAGLLFEVHRGAPFWVGSALMLSCALVALSISRRVTTGPGPAPV
jgi:MFS family permease